MNLHEYAAMLFGSSRIAAFRAAIEAVVEPGMRVLDLGAGLGTYGFFAAHAGASRVVAVDAHPVVHLARTLAARNGLGDRMEFVHARAPQGIPSERYDLILFEDYPVSFLDRGTHALLDAVASRHLGPEGRLLPGGVRFSLAPVSGEAPPSAVSDPGLPATRFGIDWGELRIPLANTGRQVRLTPDALDAPGSTTTRRSILPLADREFSARGAWVASGRPVVGLAFWFDLELGRDAWICNGPGQDAEPWGQWFLPLDPPLVPPAGAPLEGRIWRETTDDGRPGWMGWRCTADGVTRRGHEFAGLPMGLEDLLGDSDD